MFDFKFSKSRFISELLFLIMYIGWFWIVLRFNLLKFAEEWVYIIFYISYALSGLVSFCSDITPEGKIRPTVKTAGLFAIMLFFIIRFIEYS